MLAQLMCSCFNTQCILGFENTDELLSEDSLWGIAAVIGVLCLYPRVKCMFAMFFDRSQLRLPWGLWNEMKR